MTITFQNAHVIRKFVGKQVVFYGLSKIYGTLNRPNAIARLISDIFNPALVIGGLAIGVVSYSSSGYSGWLWLLWALPVLSLPPAAYIIWLVRQGEAVDIHLPSRQTRLKPLIFTLVWLSIWTVLLSYFDMPAVLVSLLKGALLQFAMLSLITLFWKISFHSAAISTAAVITLALEGVPSVWVVAVITLVIIIGWARINLRRHTSAQVIAGSLVGGVVGYFILHIFSLTVF